ncbi:MAG: hypothetical protein J0H74_31585 [Chitinophagaceae bacterium]|nr:hypothetical protein [Chitinophagaceae bacterium]
MRQELKKIDEQRELFRGGFKKYGLKSGYKGHSMETVLLVDIRDGNGNLICDHLWFNMTKGFEQLGALREGDMIQFEARVKKYRKGYVNQRAGIDQSKFDYKLSHPTRIERYRPGG